MATVFGAFGISPEAVADAVVDAAREYQKNGAPVDSHLADQLMLQTIGASLTRPTEVNSLENRQVGIHIP